MSNREKFSFEISLSVLNHLGRNLYRSFTTVLGEAISNAWDADAENVRIYINKKNNSFFIKDDGFGMTADDFRGKFLKIGYSKRKDGHTSSVKGRPYIGRKGIGKLALLSCAEKITIISKQRGGDYVGGVIDNSELDDAIDDDLTPKEYPLGELDLDIFAEYTNDHKKGTIIYFEDIKEGIKHSLEFLTKIIALYFRFSLLDREFNIFVNDEKVTQKSLSDLTSKTEFLWKINEIDDPYIKILEEGFTLEANEKKQIKMAGDFKGFIASVKKPSNLKIRSTDEKISVDLFVNGRLRERDMLKHIPTARVAESYLYGQIHFDSLNDDKDRFTSSREGVVADDPKYNDFLKILKKQILRIIEDWDVWRVKHREDGDSENTRIPKAQRKAGELYSAVSKDYDLPKSSKHEKKVRGWVSDLSDDASFNFKSYAECFISENLIRRYVLENKIPLTSKTIEEIDKFKKKERENKKDGNISIILRRKGTDLSYLDMVWLSKLADKQKQGESANCLPTDAKQYKPTRDALMHTALLTEEAKANLTSVYGNIKGRIINKLSGDE